jgi:hypothetical protein
MIYNLDDLQYWYTAVRNHRGRVGRFTTFSLKFIPSIVCCLFHRLSFSNSGGAPRKNIGLHSHTVVQGHLAFCLSFDNNFGKN